MSISKDSHISEEAAGGATGAGCVASFAMPLLSQAISRPLIKAQIKSKKKAITPKPKKKYGIRESLRRALFEDDAGAIAPDQTKTGPTEFDHEGVISKLKAAEKKDSVDRRNTQEFGLEDEDGKLVRVTIPNDQAESFEAALQAIVSRQDDEEGNSAAEIAEILFNLKDQFTFIDVQWPEIEEDEEVVDPTATEQPPIEGEELPPGEGNPDDLELGLDTEVAPDTSSGVDEVKGLLTKVIDMMKSDADARRQEAIAREKEAEVRASETAVNQALAKVKQEEQILDMEVWNKTQKEESKEAKRLAQLARWKHDMSKEHGDIEDDDLDDIVSSQLDNQAEENEEIAKKPTTKPTVRKPVIKKARNKVKSTDVASYILNKMR